MVPDTKPLTRLQIQCGSHEGNNILFEVRKQRRVAKDLDLSPKLFFFFQLRLSFEFFIMKLLTSRLLEINALTDLVLNVHLQNKECTNVSRTSTEDE